jgi:hypothetical protein
VDTTNERLFGITCPWLKDAGARTHASASTSPTTSSPPPGVNVSVDLEVHLQFTRLLHPLRYPDVLDDWTARRRTSHRGPRRRRFASDGE